MTSRTILTWRDAGPVLAVAALAAALAGCASAPEQHLDEARTTEAPNAIEVSVTHRTLAVHFEPGETAPRPKDVAALNVLLATGDIAPGDEVRIERAASVIADARARALASALARQGLRPTMVAPGGAPDGELHLVVEHATATVPRCPNWTKPPGNDFDNTLHSDFGCATALDLAAMVADPRDLIEGRPLAPVVGDAAVWAMHRYRSGAPEKSEDTSAQPFVASSTTMATAPPKPQTAQGAEDRPPAGATSGVGGGAAAAAVAGAGLAPGGYSAPPQGPQ
jgi:pilus assembly protein CpaD